MGSMQRSMKRAKAKKLYGKFSEAWRRTKKLQLEKLAKGEELDQPRLGKKPSFSQWVETIERQAQVLARKPKQEEEKIDLAWDEEETIESEETASRSAQLADQIEKLPPADSIDHLL